MFNDNDNNFISILFIIALIVLVAGICLDVFIATSTDIPLWAKLFWFLKN